MDNENDSIIILSDHGMEAIKWNVYINVYLKENGFLQSEDSTKIDYKTIKKGTKAFALDPARIYLHREGRFPNGTVKREEEEEIINDLIQLFKELNKDGQSVIKKILRREEIYHGQYTERAPDLVLLAHKGFNLRSGISHNEVFDKDMFTGKHTQEDAFLFVKTQSKIEISEYPDVSHIVKIIDRIKGNAL